MMTYTTADIEKMLRTNNFAVERALVALFERQTATEQSAEQTEEHNGVGFSAFDAAIFTSFAKQILANKGGYANGSRLSPKQFAICRKENKRGQMKIGKYCRQLAEIANAKAKAAA